MTPAGSARAIASVYSVALLATLPLLGAAVASWLLRRSTAEARALAWRSAIVALLVVFVGRYLPLHWMASVLPSLFAAPLVALGRVQVTGSSVQATSAGIDAVHLAAYAPLALTVMLVLYLAGVATVLIPTIVASISVRRSLGRGRQVNAVRWTSVVREVSDRLGIRRRVRLFISADATVAMTWGFLRPVIVLPSIVEEWNDEQRRMVLLHELAHVRAGDWLFALGARIVCALFWFHPGVGWVARGLREDCELACDDRVIAAGVRRSDYAELLMTAADRMPRSALPRGVALALARRRGLRARLAAVLDGRHDVRPLARGSAAAAIAFTLGVAGPMSIVQLAPTRDVLTTLMLDATWESRAYAVIGLAERADSVAVARSVAELDPSPRVRAWAKYALERRDNLPELRTIIRER